MKKFLVVIEKTKTGFSAYSPDLPGCVATARTKPLVERRMSDAIQFHLEGLQAARRKVSSGTSYATYVEVAV